MSEIKNPKKNPKCSISSKNKSVDQDLFACLFVFPIGHLKHRSSVAIIKKKKKVQFVNRISKSHVLIWSLLSVTVPGVWFLWHV